MALDALLQKCRAWKHRHLLGTKDLSPNDISLVLDVAEELSTLKDAAPLKGKRLFNFFVEPSTRTKTSFALVARLVESSVVNAGDGTNEHPTQALLDLFTMRQRLGKITGLRVALVGDIMHSRVARSNLWALQKLKNKVT